MVVADWLGPAVGGAATLAVGFIGGALAQRRYKRTQPHAEAVATQHAVTGMNAEIGRVRESFVAEMTSLRTGANQEFSGIRAGLDALRTENAQLRTELRADLSHMREDVRGLHDVLEEQRVNVDRLHALIEKFIHTGGH